MTWLLYTFGSVVLFTLLYLVQRSVAVDSKNPRAATFVFNFYAILLSLVIFFLTKSYNTFALPTELIAWVYAGFAVIMYGLFERGRFVVAKLLDASVNAIVGNIYIIVVFVGTLILYSEPITIPKIIGAFLIISSLFIISYSPKKTYSFTLKGILLGILIEIFLGLAGTMDKMGVTYFNPDTYNLVVWIFPLIVIFFPYIKLKDIKEEFKLGSWKIFIMSAINVLGYLLLLKALNLNEASRITPIIQTSNLLTVLLGIVVLKEKENILRKILGGIMALAGVYLLIAVT